MAKLINKASAQNSTTAAAVANSPARTTNHAFRNVIAVGVAAIAMVSCGTTMAESNDGFSTPKRFMAGIDVNSNPRVAETGLPMYPGAIIERDGSDGSDSSNTGENVSGVNLDLWFGKYGMKLVVVKLKTEDSADQVAAFYRKALAERGEVLDCSREARDARYTSRKAERKAEKNSKAVTCSEINISDVDEKKGEKSSRRRSDEKRDEKRDQKRDESRDADGENNHDGNVDRNGKVFKAGTRQKQYSVSVQTKGSGSTFQLLHLEKRGGDE